MDKKIEKFIKEHGHNFHAMVVNKLRDQRWTVLISPFYRDNATDKAREADIIAEKEIFFGNDNGNIRYIKKGFFRVRLIIECKFVKETIVFWFDQKDVSATEKRIIKDIPLFKPSDENIFIEKHHWRATGRAAKLYATYNPNSKEKQTENELVFSAVDKVLNCLVNCRDRGLIIPKNKRLNPAFCIYGQVINYPVIVFNDFSSLYQTNINGLDKPEKFANDCNFEIEVNYEYINFTNGQRLNMPEYFLVDIVNFSNLEDYLKNLKDKDLLSALQLS